MTLHVGERSFCRAFSAFSAFHSWVKPKTPLRMTITKIVIASAGSPTANEITVTDNGDGTVTLSFTNNITAEKNADYTILDNDRILHIEVTTGAADKTITLPTLADNATREILITKVDSGAGEVIIDGEGTETVSGDLTRTIMFQYTTAQIKASANEWLLI